MYCTPFRQGLPVDGIIRNLCEYVPDFWGFYRRRVLQEVMLGITFAVLGFGLDAFLVDNARPVHHPICCETPMDYSAAEYEQVLVAARDRVALNSRNLTDIITSLQAG